MHSTRSLASNFLPDETFKVIFINKGLEFVVGNLNGELKIFDLKTMLLKRIIYAFQGNTTHLVEQASHLVCVGNDLSQRLGVQAQIKVYNQAKDLIKTIAVSKPVK